MAAQKRSGQHVRCPQCGRTLEARVNRWGDLVYPRHMMALQGDSEEVYLGPQLDPHPIHPGVVPDYEIPCPMAGQAVEE